MELYTEWVTKKYPGCVDYTDESRQITCDRGGPAVGWGVSRAVTISPPTPLVLIDRMLLALTHQSILRTRATFSCPTLYNKYSITFMNMHCSWSISSKPGHSDIAVRN